MGLPMHKMTSWSSSKGKSLYQRLQERESQQCYIDSEGVTLLGYQKEYLNKLLQEECPKKHLQGNTGVIIVDDTIDAKLNAASAAHGYGDDGRDLLSPEVRASNIAQIKAMMERSQGIRPGPAPDLSLKSYKPVEQMKLQEIIDHPDKVSLIQHLLKELTDRTKRMYDVERELKKYEDDKSNEQLKKDLETAMDLCFHAGLAGTARFYCSVCKDRVAGKTNLELGVGFKCAKCDHAVIEIKDIDAVTEKMNAEQAALKLAMKTQEYQKATQHCANLGYDLEKLKQELRDLKAKAVFPTQEQQSTGPVRAKRGIRL